MNKLNELNSLVNKSKLPSQLKEYFTSSTRNKEIVDVDTIEDIEDLYIFYNSLYIFDTSEFSDYTITSLKKCKDLKSFYFYLKKVIDTNMELKSRGNRKSNKEFYINGKPINMSFHETITEFCRLIDKIHKGEKDINLFQTYKSLGKMELINI